MKKTTLFAFLFLSCALFAETNRIIFHHLPKTGGQTFSKVFSQHFTPEEILPEPHQYLIKDKPLSELAQYKLIRGHFLFPRFRGLSARRITFLRDPVARVLSAHRYYEKIYKNNPQRMTLQHMCPPEDPLKGARNQQCRFLSGLDVNNPAISDRQHLESAKRNLRYKFFFVGITEDLDNAISTLCSLLEFPPPPEIPKLNTTEKPKKKYSQKIIRKIEKRNPEDIELYQFAKDLYERKYKQVNPVPTQP